MVNGSTLKNCNFSLHVFYCADVLFVSVLVATQASLTTVNNRKGLRMIYAPQDGITVAYRCREQP